MINKHLFVVFSCFTGAWLACADHGPATAGGGSNTQSGETLKRGQLAIETRFEFTEFEHLSQAEIDAGAAAAEHFDYLDSSLLTTQSFSYGVTNDVQLGIALGYYAAFHPRQAELEGTDTEIVSFNPDGLTDLWLTSKWRFHKSRAGNFAIFGGVKFPTGRDNVRNSHGERVEPAATAGSGAVDGMIGLAYSRWLTSRLALDASVQYIIRGKAHDFRLGDRLDGGVTLAYRLTPDIQRYPQTSVFLETNVRHLFRNEEEGESDPNSGGTVLFLSTGIRVGFSKHFAVTLAPQVPVVQDLNGRQLETEAKVVATFSGTF